MRASRNALLAVGLVFVSTITSCSSPPPVGSCVDGFRTVALAWPRGIDKGFGVDVRDVAVISATDAWLVGTYQSYPAGYSPPPPGSDLPTMTEDRALIEHWDGTVWRQVHSPSGPSTRLNGVSAMGPDDVWAVGTVRRERGRNLGWRPTILHWDGSRWSVVIPSVPGQAQGDQMLVGVAAISPDDVWAVGMNGSGKPGPFSIHWDGTRWQVVEMPTPQPFESDIAGIVAVSSRDAWAVGETFLVANSVLGRTFIEHWDGHAWSYVKSPITSGGFSERNPNRVSRPWLYAAAATGPDDVWAAGGNEAFPPRNGFVLEHWDGYAWHAVRPALVPGGSFSDIAAVAADDVWAVGSTFIPGKPSGPLIEHWDGRTWTPEASPIGRGDDTMVIGVGPRGTMWITGGANTAGDAVALRPCQSP